MGTITKVDGFYVLALREKIKRKLPLNFDNDWMDLVNGWEYAEGDIPIYMLAINSPSKYYFLVKQLISVNMHGYF